MSDSKLGVNSSYPPCQSSATKHTSLQECIKKLTNLYSKRASGYKHRNGIKRSLFLEKKRIKQKIYNALFNR